MDNGWGSEELGDGGLGALTPHERRVALAAAEGQTNKAVARTLSISTKTVEFHLANSFRKLGVANRGEMAHLLHRRSSETASSEEAAPRGSLPVKSAPVLYGRDIDRNQLLEACERRLVTLTGPGGGKTTLALDVAWMIADRFSDGAWFVDLTRVSDDAEVATEAAFALGITVRRAEIAAEDLARSLEAQARLVVLDNCEHVFDGAAQLARTLVTRCPNVVVLATSRERLDVAAEQVIGLNPLGVTGGPAGSPAAALFIERARDVGVDLVLTDDRNDDIDSVCRQLEGVPLAIELAAARLGATSLTLLSEQLQQGLAPLRRRRKRGDRHDSLSASIEWSCGLLAPAERRLLAALSIFPRDFDLDAALAVGGGDAIDGIATLVDSSLLIAETTSGPMRYRMLRTIRAFASEQLDDDTDRDVAQHAHLQHFCDVIRRAGAAMRGPGEPDAHHTLNTEWPNCRAAFRTACTLDDHDLPATIIRDLLLWAASRNRTEVGAWADTAAALAPQEPELRIAVASCQAIFAGVSGDLVTSADFVARALAEDARSGSTSEPWAQWASIWPTTTWADAVTAASSIEARGIARRDPYWIAVATAAQASLSSRAYQRAPDVADHPDDLLPVSDKAVELATAIGRPSTLATALQARGVAVGRNDPAAGRVILQRSIAVARQDGSLALEVDDLVEIVRLSLVADDTEHAVEAAVAIMTIAEQPPVAPRERRHLMRFVAEALATTSNPRPGPAASRPVRPPDRRAAAPPITSASTTHLNERLVAALGTAEYERRIETGAAGDVHTAADRYHFLTPW